MAAPVAAGCLALAMSARPDLWEAQGQQFDPKYGVMLPARMVRARELLIQNSLPLLDRDHSGYGLIQADRLASALTPTTGLPGLVWLIVGGVLLLAAAGSRR